VEYGGLEGSAREDLLRVIEFDSDWVRLAANLPLRPDSEEPVLLGPHDVRRAVELVDLGRLGKVEAGAWSEILLRRRDVVFEAGWSVVLIQFLEEWAFEAALSESAEVWLERLAGKAPAVPEQSLVEVRLDLLRQVVLYEDSAPMAMEVLRREGQEFVEPAGVLLQTDDVARVIELVLEGAVTYTELKQWSTFVLGRRDIRFDSLRESWMLGGVLVDCAGHIPEDELHMTLVGELSIIGTLE
jgi:hypothetical protein